MKQIRIGLAVFLTVALTLVGPSASAFWSPPSFGPPDGNIKFALNSADLIGGSQVSKVTFLQSRGMNQFPILDCLDFKSSGCDLARVSPKSIGEDGLISAQASVIFPSCSVDYVTSCIEQVSVRAPKSKFVIAKFEKMSAPDFSIKGAQANGLPGGGSIPIFSSSEPISPSGGNKFIVRIQADFSYSKNDNRFIQNRIRAIVSPIATRTAQTNCVPRWADRQAYSGANNITFPDSHLLLVCPEPGAFFVSENQATVPDDFIEGTRVGIKLRIPKETGGWFSGQFANVDAVITNLSATDNRLTLEADVAKVPQLSVVIPKEMITPDFTLGLTNVYNDIQRTPSGFGGYIYEPGNDQSVDAVIKLRVAANDMSNAENVVWNFKSGQRWRGQNCLTSTAGITGIIATNAMTYASDQPAFENGVFDFKVAGMHFNSDRSKAVGTYDLLMRSEFARCLYGFSKAPVSGTVSVVSDDGTPSIATTSVVEKDGFIKLTARNFGFSQKQIVGKLIQKKKTLTCLLYVKKKIRNTLFVNSVACPKGYVAKK